MKYLRVVFFLVTLLFLHDISAQDGCKFTINSQKNKDVDAQIEKTLPLIIKACPGLEKYAEDLSPADACQSLLSNPEYEGGLLLEFVVSEHPKKLPRPLNVYSKGHHCFIDVSISTDKMYISKRACHSICSGSWTENDAGSMGREFNLIP